MFSETLRLLDREEEKLVIQEAYDELRRTKEKRQELQRELQQAQQEMTTLKLLLEQILAEKYDINITESVERLVDDMCNLSNVVEAIGIEKGLERGFEAVTTTCRDLGISFIDTVGRIADKFNISQKEAEEKIRKYW